MFGSKKLDHSKAPILDALVAYRERGDTPFGPPGHRQGRGVDRRVLDVLGKSVFEADVLLLNGLDDRRESQGVLSQAQELMADAVHADQAFFSTCGSSLSVKSAMMAVAGPREKILISRNAHKSVVSALILSGHIPVWVHPKWHPELALAHPPEPDDVRRALQENPDAKGMLLISPTDWGSAADVAGVAQVCHEFDVPLLVDEAWGAHLPFHDDLPPCGMQAGADLAIVSVHKMGMAVEQSSVFHIQGDRIDPTVLSMRADLLSTTSPTSLVYATLDGWRRQMVEEGEQLIGQAMQRAQRIAAGIAGHVGLTVLDEEIMAGPGKAFAMDPLKITVDVSGLGITGYQATEWLRTNQHVDLAAADVRRMQAQINQSDDDLTEHRLRVAVEALTANAHSLERSPEVALPPVGSLELEMAMRPRDAFFAAAEQIPIDQAVGRVAAELVSPYPPGVPAIAPGEVINQEVVDYLTTGLAAGMMIPDAADAELKTVRVVAR
jgi:arginine/lysine/ornithine decarboxylase